MHNKTSIDAEEPAKGTNWLYALLVFVPVSIALHFLHGSQALIFAASCLAIVPLAGVMSEATDELACHLGSTWGGLLNATFGNATELIIAIIAIQANLLNVVKASIAGSIIGNLLLVVGASFLAGGLKYKVQSFNKHLAGTHSALLVMSVLALTVPAVFVQAVPGLYAQSHGNFISPKVENLSLGVAGILIVVYLASLFFSLKTHESLFLGAEEPDPKNSSNRGVLGALGLLAVATLFIALESEYLVGTVEAVTRTMGLTEIFVGVVVVAIIGNAAEHATAIAAARRNQMELSLNIAIGSSTQIALFVAPLLVFVSLAVGHPMTLIFNPFELVSIVFAVVITAVISLDGQSHWLEGVLLLASYAVIALAFFFIPNG